MRMRAQTIMASAGDRRNLFSLGVFIMDDLRSHGSLHPSSRPQKCRPGDALAAHDDCDGRDSYRDMKKRYGNRQNMTEVFAAFAVPQLFLGLMFKRLTFGEKLLFILAVALREFPMFRPCGQSPPARRNR